MDRCYNGAETSAYSFNIGLFKFQEVIFDRYLSLLVSEIYFVYLNFSYNN